jgi:hypothetical protein
MDSLTGLWREKGEDIMNDAAEEQISPGPRWWWGPVTIGIGIVFVVIFLFSGLRLYEAIAALEPDTTAGQVQAVAVALCIEAGVALASYRVWQLERRERPIPAILFWFLGFSVVVSALANIDHLLRRTPETGAGLSGLALFWEILLGVVLSLAYPVGTILAAAVLAEHMQAVDEGRAAFGRFRAEVEQRLAAAEEVRAIQEQFHQEMRQRLAGMEQLINALAVPIGALGQRLAEQAVLDEPVDGEPAVASPAPATEAPSRWELLWQRTNGKGFNNDLVQEVFERGKTTAYQLMEEAIAGGLIEKVRPGRYRFVAASEQDIREWVAVRR